MTDTPEHEPSETTARTGLAGGAARALRAARQSAPTGSEAVETTAAEPDTVADPVADAPPGSTVDEAVAAEAAEAAEPVEADRVAETPAPQTPVAEPPVADPAVAEDAEGTDAEELAGHSPVDSDDSDDASNDASNNDATATAIDDPDAPPVLTPVRAPKRKAAGSRASASKAAQSEAAVLDLVTPEPKDTTRTRLIAISALLTAAALVFAVIAVVIWWRAGHDDTRDAAAARDEVAVDARLAIATVNTSDYRKPANALTNWIDVATGSLEKQFTTSRASATTLLAQAKKVTTATVLDVAVTKLDDRSATVLASVNVKQQPVTGTATFVRNRFRASMTKVGDEWKLADLAQVDLQLS